MCSSAMVVVFHLTFFACQVIFFSLIDGFLVLDITDIAFYYLEAALIFLLKYLPANTVAVGKEVVSVMIQIRAEGGC